MCDDNRPYDRSLANDKVEEYGVSFRNALEASTILTAVIPSRFQASCCDGLDTTALSIPMLRLKPNVNSTELTFGVALIFAEFAPNSKFGR